MVFGRSRPSVDADGHRGGCPPRSRMEPELTVEGKVVLVGNPVINPVVDFPDEGYSASGSEGRRSDSSNDYQIDDRDGPESREQIEYTSPPERASESEEKKNNGSWNWIFGTQEEVQPQVAGSISAPWSLVNGQQTGSKLSRKSSGIWGTMFQFSDQSRNADRGDDESFTEEASTHKLFGDLNSLPSEHGELTISGASMHSADFASRDDRSVVRDSVVEEKLREICVTKPEPTNRPGLARKTKMEQRTPDSELHHRRSLLVKELRNAISTYGRYDLRCASISCELGDLLDKSGEHDESIKLHKDAVTIYTVKLGDHSETTMDAKIGLAAVLTNAGEFDEAISIYFYVTAMRRELLGDKDPSVADGLALMSHALRKNGDYLQAIKELKRALKIYRGSLGDSHDKVSTAVDAIASLYVTIGDFEKSSAILEEVVKLKAATVGMKSKAVAETLTNLAMTYECSEQFTQAMKALKKAYKIYTEIGGYSSEDATNTLHKIALLYEATGDFNRASIAFLGVLRGRKIHHGEDHLLVGEIYCKLGHALRETGQLEKALKCMKEALPIFVGKGVEMNDVEKIAEIMHEMAIIYKKKEHFGEAARIFKQELSVRRKIGQPEFPYIARTLNHLGVTEYEMKNNSRALKYLVEALTIFQDQGEHGVDCAEVLYNTGLVFAAVRNRDRALEAFYEAERLFSDHGCKDTHPSRVQTQREIVKIRESARYK